MEIFRKTISSCMRDVRVVRRARERKKWVVNNGVNKLGNRNVMVSLQCRSKNIKEEYRRANYGAVKWQ